ncbi:MAG: glycosyltransferase [Desulfotomaculaceae bacterium]|nr:glycosyltransferase [Desulfotomaculaceae bacterium]
MQKAYSLPPDNVTVIPFGVYDSYKNHDRSGARQELNLNKFVILHFGMIRKYKGIPLLIKAFDMLPPEIAHNSQLVIAGEDWGDDPELEVMIKHSRYNSSILYKPEFIPDPLVPKYFAAADVIALPYLRSCGSGVVHLALAQDKLVLTSDLPVMRECLNGYEGAQFFPVGDAEMLKKKIIDTYRRWQSGDLKDFIGFGATWADVAGKYMQIIEGLVV